MTWFMPMKKKGRRVRLTPADLQFMSQNQQMEGFSGRITKVTAKHEPDMGEIAASANHLNAQTPSPNTRARKPRIAKFGSHTA